MSLPCDFPELPAQRVVVVGDYRVHLHLQLQTASTKRFRRCSCSCSCRWRGGIHLHLQLQATSTEQYRHRGFPAPPLDWPNVLWLIIPGIAKVSVSSLYSPSQNVPVSLNLNKHSRVSMQLDWCLNHTIVFNRDRVILRIIMTFSLTSKLNVGRVGGTMGTKFKELF